MQRPWTIRSAVKTGSDGMAASRAVGIDRIARLARMPRLLSIRRPNSATPKPPAAMPMVLALTAKAMAAGVTP